MYIPTLEGIIERRLLVNYRVDPAALQRLLPAPFRPKLIHGMGLACISLIRLKQLRPEHCPPHLDFPRRMPLIASRWNGKSREPTKKGSLFLDEMPLRGSTPSLGAGCFLASIIMPALR
jgi:hypothetical protein